MVIVSEIRLLFNVIFQLVRADPRIDGSVQLYPKLVKSSKPDGIVQTIGCCLYELSLQSTEYTDLYPCYVGYYLHFLYYVLFMSGTVILSNDNICWSESIFVGWNPLTEIPARLILGHD